MHAVNIGCFNFSTPENIRGISSSSIKNKKELPILIVTFPFQPLPKIIVFFFCLAALDGSFPMEKLSTSTKTEMINMPFQLQVIYESLILIGN